MAHLGPANNTSNRLNGLLSPIRVTADAGVCPIPARVASIKVQQSKKQAERTKPESNPEPSCYEAAMVTTLDLKKKKKKSNIEEDKYEKPQTASTRTHTNVGLWKESLRLKNAGKQ